MVMARGAAKKQKSLERRKRSSSDSLPKNPETLTPKSVGETLLECIQSGNLEAFREILTDQIMKSNKVRLAKKSGLGRQTLYDLIDSKRDFNPALATVAAVMRGLGT